MKCQKCKKNVSEDSLFCEHCGAKIEKPEPEIDSNSKEDKEIQQKIIDHLEFIGYDVKATDTTGAYMCKHATKNNIYLNFRDNTGVTFVVLFSIDKKKIEKNKLLAYEYINTMNNRALLASFSLNDDLTGWVIGGWYPNIYTKKTFATFVQCFETDITRAIQTEGVLDLFG